jgi:hypothetical protein
VKLSSLLLCFCFGFLTILPPLSCTAEPVPAPVSAAVSLPIAAGSAAAVSTIAQAAPAPLDSSQAPAPSFFQQLVDTIKTFGGLETLAKISAILLLVVASMKVSFLNSLIWSKLGAYQSLVAPALGLIAGVVSAFVGHSGLSLASALGLIIAYLGSGVGAVGLHELLDDVKAIPGIGPTYVAIIEAIESALGGPKASA